MAFQITARTLLELGAELISSDAVALYEIVKNSVDAGSPTVRITVEEILPHSRYQQALEAIDETKIPLSSIRQDIESWLTDDGPAIAKRRLLAALDNAGKSRNVFREALIEAANETNFIEIVDEGEGMSLRDLNDVYLMIGTRSRRREKLAWNQDGKDPSRVFLGDKGVGRLSVMRLGHRLEITTSKTNETHWNRLEIDWREFSHESDALLHEIPVSPKKGGRKDDPGQSGTTIRISDLRTDWDRKKFGSLVNTEFARMVDPFDRRRANRLFRISYNGEHVTLPQIAKRLFEMAHAVVTCRYFYDESGEGRLVGEMDYRLHTNRKKSFTYSEVELVSWTASKSTKVIRTLGPFEVEFLWFNRLHLTALEGLGTRNDVLALVRRWAGGLMVFRDGFRINPYGGADDDWLQLDKKAFSRSGYKLNRQQIIGRVSLSWRNNFLVEQTNREGLVDNDHKDAFMKVLLRILENFKTFSQGIENELKREELTSLDVLKRRVIEARTEVQKRIRQIALDVPKQAGALREVERIVQQLSEQIDGVDEIIDDYKDERRKFIHLAGLGLMVELILHELGRATGNTLGTLESIDPKDLPGRLPSVFETLETQLKTLQKRIQSLDPLSTARRQVKENFIVQDLVQQIVEARAAQAQRHNVEVRVDASRDAPWRVKAVKGMLIQIIENLLANSFYWLKYQAIVKQDFRPRIVVNLNSENQIISVTDNGPGVEPSRAEEIFEPFVTSKPPGQGSGLGLYIARELAAYHDWTLNLISTGRGSQTALHTFALDMSGGSKG